jgi:cytochrome c oxidase cbb3-type subunit 3
MSYFWSHWVMVLVVLTFGNFVALFVWGNLVSIPTELDETSGRVWAGWLREAVRTVPRWWITLAVCAFTSSFIYLVLYPGFGANPGTLGWTSLGELERATAMNDARLDPVLHRFTGQPVETLARSPAALRIGARLFADDCAACHGPRGRGNPLIGAPNLTDTDWLYGGGGDSILRSIVDGRHGTMPAWGAAFGKDGVERLANYVLSLSGAPHDATKAAIGKAMFTACAACQGPQGKGNPALGAPNLTDTIWLYGGDLATVEASIRDGRGGVMPAWRRRLPDSEARAVAAFVYQLSPRTVTTASTSSGGPKAP